tara:strand:- start:2989 stop:3687 length:699 start_codon:yes stop_codon:yes gene_type:complete
MAQVQPAVNSFVKNIEKLERKFQGRLRTVVRGLSAMSDSQLITAVGQLNLFNEIIEQGYGDALNNLDAEYEKILSQAVAEATKRGLTPLGGAGLQGLETLRDLNTAELLGSARAYSNRLTTSIFQNLYAGVSINDTISALEGIPLADYQLNTATYTSIKTFDDTARYKVFEGLDVKWTYFGPLDSKTRESCRNTKDFEKRFPKGLSEQQVLDSETPFGFRGGFNCRHSWEVK